MEPFKLTLQQVTFEEDQLDCAPNLDSFDTVVNYDSSFSGSDLPSFREVTTSSHISSDFNSNSSQSVGVQSSPATLFSGQQPFLSTPPVRVQSRSHPYSVDPVWSDHSSGSPPYQRYLVNPYDSFSLTDENRHQHVPKTTSQDIAFLAQVSANTSAVSKHIKFPKKPRFVGKTTVITSRTAPVINMPSEDKNPVEDLAVPAGDGTNTFETVAEALRLQWSVIGNKDIAPASPDVVAQIVADAERRLKGGGATSPDISGVSLDGASPVHNEITTLTLKSSDGSSQYEVLSRSRENSSSSISQSDEIHEMVSHKTDREPFDVGKTVEAKDQQKELIRIPAGTLTTTKEKSSWFASKDGKGNKTGSSLKGEKDNQNPKPNRKISQESATERSMNGTVEKLDDSRSVSSISSEQEIERYAQNETDAFLKSLPEVKTVDMSEFASTSRVKHRHSPPVKETSFKPVHSSSVPAVSHSNHTESGVGLDVGSMLQQPLTSTPFPSRSDKPGFLLPQIEPLFPKITGQVFHNTNSSAMQGPNTTRINDSSLTPAMKKRLEDALREKAKLEGQLEVLTAESQSTLQERAELQAQLASLRLKLLAQKGSEIDPEKESLYHDIDHLKKSREFLEQSLADNQRLVEEKLEEAKIVQDELQMSQETTDKLEVKMKDLRDDLTVKEMTVQALKNKVAELYVEVQNAIQAKMESENESRSAKSDLTSLLSKKEWYQQQLQLAHEVRSQLQKELTILQAQTVSQGTIVERLKTDNSYLRQQLNEAQQRTLKQKEVLAKHLETIETDMMEREAAFQEIQRERSLIEDTFNTQIQSVEDEKSRLNLLMQVNNDLESRLDKTQEDLKKKHMQIFSLENEQMELMKKLTLSQENILEKDKIVEDLNQRLIEVEDQLKAFQTGMGNKDMEVLKLKEEKAATEIALKGVLQEKASVDNVLQTLQGDMVKVEKSFKQMRQELGMKLAELEKVTADKKQLQHELDIMKKELSIKNRSYDTIHRDFDGKSAALQDLQIQRQTLENEVVMLKEKLTMLHTSQQNTTKEKELLAEELNDAKLKLGEAQQLVEVTHSKPEDSLQRSEAVTSDGKFQEILEENETLKQKLTEVVQHKEKESVKQREIRDILKSDLSAVKSELTERQKAFESNVETLKAKLHDVLAEKHKLETELEMTNRKFELSTIEQQDQIKTELQSLASELEMSRYRQQELENQLIILQQAKDAEIISLRQELSVLVAQIQNLQDSQSDNQQTEELNQQLSLDLEKERGRLAGLAQNNSALKQHVTQLEEALARREGSLVELHSHLQETMQGKEREEQEYIHRIQGFEESLQKEKNSQRDLRKQIGTKITENKRLKKQQDLMKAEQTQLKQDLQFKEQEVSQLKQEVDNNRQAVLAHQNEVANLQTHSRTVEHELERVRRELEDNVARNPVLMEQIQSLQWQLSQKNKEVEQAQEQMKLAEKRQQIEIETMRKTIQEKQEEIEALQEKVANARQQKIDQRSRVTQLRSALKSSVQHHKLAKKLQSRKKEHAALVAAAQETVSSGEDKGTQVNFEDDVVIPSPPFDLDAVEKLLQDTGVRALDSKPLDNIHTCLSSLRAEISGLQKEMDVHTTTVHTSTQSWRSIESEVQELREVVKTVANTTLAATLITTNATDVVESDSGLIHI